MSMAPILALLDFFKSFTVETNACDSGIRVVLVQEGRPLAFISQALSLSVFDKELLTMLRAIDKWHHYLKGSPFVFIIDHESLQFLAQ